MTDNPWAWDGRNPYRSTPFQVLDLPPDITGRAEIRARIQRRRRRIDRGADRFPLFDRTLSVADVNRAEEQIADVAARLRAELLTHRPESGDLAPAGLAERYAQLPVPAGAVPDVTLEDRVLRGLLPDPSARPPAPLWEGMRP